MSVVNTLHEAIETKDWEKVKAAYYLLGGSGLFSDLVENIDAEDARLLNAMYEGSGETPPKRKRGRPKKNKEVSNTGPSEIAKPAEVIQAVPTFTLSNIDQFKMVRGTPQAEVANGEKRAARLEPFQPPKGNKFDPKAVKEDRELGYDKINDNVPRIPRTRPPAEQGKTVFCSDCGANVLAPVTSGFCSGFGKCEYAAAGKKDKCPYTR